MRPSDPEGATERASERSTASGRGSVSLSRRSALAALGVGAVGLGGLAGSERLGATDLLGDGESSPSAPADPLSLVPSSAVTHRATASGRWTDADVWDGGSVAVSLRCASGRGPPVE